MLLCFIRKRTSGQMAAGHVLPLTEKIQGLKMHVQLGQATLRVGVCPGAIAPRRDVAGALKLRGRNFGVCPSPLRHRIMTF